MTWTVKGQGLMDIALQDAIIEIIEEKLLASLNGDDPNKLYIYRRKRRTKRKPWSTSQTEFQVIILF